MREPNTTAKDKKKQKVNQTDWNILLNMLPKNLDVLAQQTGALLRRREIHSASVLIRLLLLWALTGFGLRTIAAWFARSGIVRLTEGALRHRFGNCENFIKALLAHRLSDWVGCVKTGIPLRLVDATMVPIPASKRTWRIHVTFDPLGAKMTGVDITTDNEGESLSRAAKQQGDLLVADRGYAHASKLIEAAQKVWWLVRIHFQNLKLYTTENKRLDSKEIIQQADAGNYESTARIKDGSKYVDARLVVMPLPSEKAKLAREKLQKRASKRGRTADPWAVHLAGYLCLLTTLPGTVANADDIVRWYRIRWQIELFFKRCKSLLNLHVIQSTDPVLVRVHLLAILLIASLIDRLNNTRPEVAPTCEEAKAIREMKGPTEVTAVSLWRLTQIHWLDMVITVANSDSLSKRLERRADTEQRLRERSRKRHKNAAFHSLNNIQERLIEAKAWAA